ncbi:MAG: type II toxin-antitoxin system HicB family antitoxin [Opitutaceae bacterium]|nr:type II toxin-antitoxin system HicB family antitoxin [Opitutaceae bacterium]
MDTLSTYRKLALKAAVVEELGDGEGYVARIAGFRGVIGYGATKKETLADLESALEGWVELALKRGVGLPAINARRAEPATAA